MSHQTRKAVSDAYLDAAKILRDKFSFGEDQCVDEAISMMGRKSIEALPDPVAIRSDEFTSVTRWNSMGHGKMEEFKVYIELEEERKRLARFLSGCVCNCEQDKADAPVAEVTS